MLPNFIGIGAPKAGTTTLHEILKQHPEIYLPPCKETQFFVNSALMKMNFGYLRYEQFFADANHKAVGEICPNYLQLNYCPEILHKYLGPELKIIICLRDPVNRSFSQYHMDYNLFTNNCNTFEEAIINDEKYMQLDPSCGYILNSSLYAKHIKNYLSYFKKENIFFIVSEVDLLKNSTHTIQKLLNFLNVDNSVKLTTNVIFNKMKCSQFEYFDQTKINNIESKTQIKNTQKQTKTLFSKIKDNIKYIFTENQILPNSVNITVRNNAKKLILNPSTKLRNEIAQFKSPEPPSLELRQKLIKKYFYDDICQLEKIINRDLSHWKK